VNVDVRRNAVSSAKVERLKIARGEGPWAVAVERTAYAEKNPANMTMSDNRKIQNP
jgi:hypothetical protein